MSRIDGGGEGVAAIAASALGALQARMRIIAENLANAASTAITPGGEPYRRQVPVFEALRTEAGEGVRMKGVKPDMSAFGKDYNRGHPAADAAGYVLTSNVNGLVEALDMKQAMRAYEANLNVLETQDAMDKRTLSLLQR